MVRGARWAASIYGKMFRGVLTKILSRKALFHVGKSTTLLKFNQERELVSQQLKLPAIRHNEVSRKGTMNEVNSSVKVSKEVEEHCGEI